MRRIQYNTEYSQEDESEQERQNSLSEEEFDERAASMCSEFDEEVGDDDTQESVSIIKDRLLKSIQQPQQYEEYLLQDDLHDIVIVLKKRIPPIKDLNETAYTLREQFKQPKQPQDLSQPCTQPSTQSSTQPIQSIEVARFPAHKQLLSMSSQFFRTFIYSKNWSQNGSTYSHGDKGDLLEVLREVRRLKKRKLEKGVHSWERKREQKREDKKREIKLIIEVNKVAELELYDCDPVHFSLFLRYCYNHSLPLLRLPIDTLIQLSTLVDRFLCPPRMLTQIKRALYARFTVVYGVKIYVWALRYFPEEREQLGRFQGSMIVGENVKLVFHKGVFRASGLREMGLGEDPTVAEEMAYLLRTYLNQELSQQMLPSPKYDPIICFYFDRITELSETFQSNYQRHQFLTVNLLTIPQPWLSKLNSARMLQLINMNMLPPDVMKYMFTSYLTKHQNSQHPPKDRRYFEISDKIKKVLYNAENFNQHNFEARAPDQIAFNFNSKKIGKFIECEFTKPFYVVKSRITSLQEAQITFVIQASKDREQWHLISAVRQLKGTSEIKWQQLPEPYAYWRYVVVDHGGQRADFASIEWFVKGEPEKDQPQPTQPSAEAVPQSSPNQQQHQSIRASNSYVVGARNARDRNADERLRQQFRHRNHRIIGLLRTSSYHNNA
ncbi:hypothetical protein FGO68_gene3698 [Halteria grandinella]|uniref:BTB domain-containing protein n=1 Tax=Halteria grandinella TaxID=5974 RepID=A0A8J8NX24_HALGN|nr:hypothetical protein FGO68_gene3698 [Halteria grandinella]